MSETCTCPECGSEFDPSEKRRALEEHISEKLDHGAYRDASYQWMARNTLYVYLPSDTLYTRTVENHQLPDAWRIGTVWSESDRTTVSIVLDE